MQNEDATATNPVFVFSDDVDTGVGSNALDELSLVAGGTEMARFDDDATNDGQVVLPSNSIGASEIYQITESYPWLASGTFTDEADCNAPARVADVGGSGGPAMSTITCPLGGTNLDGDIYGNTLMPAEWNAGTVQLEIEVRIHDDPGATETMQGVFNAQCVSDEDVVSNSWTANTGLDVTFVSGDVQWDTQKVTSSTLTPDGSCAAGDSIYWRYVVCDTGTPPTTGCSASTHDVANTHIVGFRLIWTSNVS
jgi:hypothetical protein